MVAVIVSEAVMAVNRTEYFGVECDVVARDCGRGIYGSFPKA